VKAAISDFAPYGVKWGVFRYTQGHAMLPADKGPLHWGRRGCRAIDEKTALEAVSFIKADYYEPLPAVFDPLLAVEKGVPQIHKDYENNINVRVHIDVGEVDKAMEGHIWQEKIPSRRQARPTP
jgi:hypothetical protein